MRLIQIVSLLVAMLLGCLVLAKKVGAQGTAPTGQTGQITPAKPKIKDAGVEASAPISATATPDAGTYDPDGGAIDYATVQTEDDLPKGISDEEKAAIGTGKVPIHREGELRSPFARPRFGGPAHVKVGLVISEVREFNIQTGGFEADFFLSLTSDKDMPLNMSFEFTNGHEVTAKSLADTPTFKFHSVTGKFTADIDLRKYPYDTQNLAIQIPVVVKHFGDPHGYYRWDIEKLGDCERPIETKTPGSYEKGQECREVSHFGRKAGFDCSRKPFKGLVSRCPWMARD